MKVFAVLAIFTLSAISVSTGLKCYKCIYEDGAINSQDDCENNPPEKYLSPCTGNEAFSDESSQVSQASNIFGKVFDQPKTSPTALNDVICYKLTAEVGGRKHVERDCTRAHKDEDLNGKCEDRRDVGNIKKIKACFCTKDGCNSGVSLVSLPILTMSGLGLLTSYLKF